MCVLTFTLTPTYTPYKYHLRSHGCSYGYTPQATPTPCHVCIMHVFAWIRISIQARTNARMTLAVGARTKSHSHSYTHSYIDGTTSTCYSKCVWCLDMTIPAQFTLQPTCVVSTNSANLRVQFLEKGWLSHTRSLSVCTTLFCVQRSNGCTRIIVIIMYIKWCNLCECNCPTHQCVPLNKQSGA